MRSRCDEKPRQKSRPFRYTSISLYLRCSHSAYSVSRSFPQFSVGRSAHGACREIQYGTPTFRKTQVQVSHGRVSGMQSNVLRVVGPAPWQRLVISSQSPWRVAVFLIQRRTFDDDERRQKCWFQWSRTLCWSRQVGFVEQSPAKGPDDSLNFGVARLH